MEDRSALHDQPGLGEWQCSELRDSPREQVRLGHQPGKQERFGLAQEHGPGEHFVQLGQHAVVPQCSELGDSPGEQVGLGHPAGEQVRFGLAPEHWPAQNFGQLGQCLVLQPFQYSTGTKVVP